MKPGKPPAFLAEAQARKLNHNALDHASENFYNRANDVE
jgi:hypothetical protein